MNTAAGAVDKEANAILALVGAEAVMVVEELGEVRMDEAPHALRELFGVGP